MALIRNSKLLILLLCLFAGAQIYAFRWGVIMPDTISQYGQAISGKYEDWHPPITAWIWRQLMRIHEGPAPFLVFDVLLYWSGVGLIAGYFDRRNQLFAAALAILMALLPIPFGEMGAILKDSLLASSMLVAVGFALHAEQERTNRRLLYGLFSLFFLVLASATRFNAAFAGVPILVLLLPSRLTDGWIKCIVAGIAALLLLATTSWLINGVALHPKRTGVIVSLINFDFAGMVAHGGPNPYPQAMSVDPTKVKACYSPQLFNPTYLPSCDAIGDQLDGWFHKQQVSPVRYWLSAILLRPIPWILHRLDHLNWNLRWLVPSVPNDAVYIGKTMPNDWELSYTASPAAALISKAGFRMAQSPLGRPATWIGVALSILILSPALPSRRIATGLAASVLCYGGAYAIVSVSLDMRYNLWTLLAGMLTTIVLLGDWRQMRRLSSTRLRLACLPPLVAIAGEVVAMLIA